MVRKKIKKYGKTGLAFTQTGIGLGMIAGEDSYGSAGRLAGGLKTGAGAASAGMTLDVIEESLIKKKRKRR